MPDNYEMLNEAIEKASYTTRLEYPSTKQELKQEYQQLYGKSWQKHLSEDMAQITGQKAHNEARAFNPDRINGRVGGKKAAQYVSLGRRHPHEIKEPKNISGRRAKVTWTGQLRTYDEKRMRPQRTYTATLTASQAREMRQGSYEPIFEAAGFGSNIVEEFNTDRISVQFL